MRQNTILLKNIKERMRRRGSTESRVRTDICPLKGKDAVTWLLKKMHFVWYKIHQLRVSQVLRVRNQIFVLLRLGHDKNACLKSVCVHREKYSEKEKVKPAAPPSWLQRDLKVRFIDKDFKGGRYYNSKVVKEIPGASVVIYKLSHLQLYCTAGYSKPLQLTCFFYPHRCLWRTS